MTSPRLKSVLTATALSMLAMATAVPVMAGGPHALYIFDANTGATLVDQDGSDARYPASLTKMMTLYLAFEAIDARRADMKTRIKISQSAANAAPSKLNLDPGDEISLEDAINALITKSANDVAIAIAEHLGGSEANFAKLMTAKARDLGMKATTFKNASGLPDSGQTTTARDMATLGVRLYDDFPRYFPMFATRSFTHDGATHKNHNTLMLQMPGINGIKTGYTHASGFNLVTSYQHDGRHLIGAIFGGETAARRNATMRVALSKAMARASTAKTRKPVLVARADAAEAKAADAIAKAAAAADATRKVKARETVAPAAAPVAAPEPVQAALVQPARAAAPLPSPAVAVSPPVSPAVAPAAPPAPPRFEVAKVRQIDVANATPAPRPAPIIAAPAPVAGFAQASSAPRISDVLKTRAVVKDAVAPAPAAEGPRPPSSFQQQMAVIAQNMAPAEASAARPDSPVAGAATAPALGRPPSSLDAQLAELAAPVASAAPSATVAAPAVAPPSYRLKGPQAPAPQRDAALSPPAGYEIQIGAYASPAEAEKRLAAAAAQAPAIVAGHTPTRQSVTVNEKTLYRARFSGFDAASAAAACAELNRLSINCIALKAE